jgi:hypothetical protein
MVRGTDRNKYPKGVFSVPKLKRVDSSGYLKEESFGSPSGKRASEWRAQIWQVVVWTLIADYGLGATAPERDE